MDTDDYRKQVAALKGEWRYYLHLLEQIQRSIDNYNRLIYEDERNV